MKIYDISTSLDMPMLTYPKDVPYELRLQRSLARGDSSNVSEITTSAHAGTHIDSPCHYIAGGYAIEDIPLDHLYGPVTVIDCTGVKVVTAQTLRDKIPASAQRILLKTDNSPLLSDKAKFFFKTNFVYLSNDGAQLLVDRKIKLIGIDYLSIDQSGNDEKAAHHILLGNNITIMEGVVLAEVPQGEYFLACGPLKMVGSDGAPCRAVLIKDFCPKSE
jgi:arylformamidase